MDVKTTFLNGLIEEEVYIEQPHGFETHDINTHVCRLKESFYGLNKSPKVWYGRIDGSGFTKSKADSNLYYKVGDDRIMILLIDVDDIILKGEENLISDCKKKLAS